ncbi:hypothetical protein LCGC14_0772250 [marine sediment metagenome]|uniref:HTH cro/C1-type domain-containing protein n=1 Tax=marine sediment metagenome TaxID=412755 RepID=A0A0F9SHX0_9ZZZZ
MQGQELIELVAANIRARRLELHLTQEELADRLQIGQPYLSDIENGKRSLTLVTVAQFAEGLEVTPSYLLAGQPVVAISK